MSRRGAGPADRGLGWSARVRFDLRILLYALAAGLPGIAVAMTLIWTTQLSLLVRLAASAALLGAWLAFAFAARSAVLRPLQTVSNLLAALRQEDYSIEGRHADRHDPLGLVFHEVNELRRLMRERRLGAQEATALLRTVIEQIDVAILAFDEQGQVRLVNRAAERLLREPAPRLMGRKADEIGLGFALEGEPPRTVDAAFPGSPGGRWEIRRKTFRQRGEPHELVVLSDLSRALREEERVAWQRLIRVLSHEINNSLTPIHSISQTLLSALEADPTKSGEEQEMTEGLTIIAGRAHSLRRFMTSYARMAQLPPPEQHAVDVAALVERAAALEPRGRVEVSPGPPAVIQGDADQLDQALINLVQNAVDAASETGGAVRMGWSRSDGSVEIWIEDEGPGLPPSANLFVPFFTTKPNGSGIGLALSRQIAEAHGGSLVLENRTDGSGCRARVTLPA